jgi:hypothetical protein
MHGIKEIKAKIQAEKERLKQEQTMQKFLLNNTKKNEQTEICSLFLYIHTISIRFS